MTAIAHHLRFRGRPMIPEALTSLTSRLKKKLAEEFHDQLTVGVPTNEDEAGLCRRAAQIRARKVIVKLFLHHPLHRTILV